MNRVQTSFYTLREPQNHGPVVVNVPHAGEVIPAEVGPTIVLPSGLLRRDLDLAVDRLVERAPELGATLMATTISRFVVDLNRHPQDVHAAVAEPAVEHPPMSYGRRGLFWLETTRGEAVVESLLSPEEVEARLAYYRPYHSRLTELLAARRKAFGQAILLDVHSMPSRGVIAHSDHGSEGPEIILGDNLGEACDAPFIDSIEDVFRRAGYSVTRNHPYRGGYITQHYGRPRAGVRALQIEVSRRLYMDEERLEYLPERAVAIKAALEAAITVAGGVETA